MARKNMITCVYVSDDAKSYLRRMDQRYQSQDDGGSPPVLLLGAIPATLSQVETLPNIPHDLKPRTLLLRTSDGAFTARVDCFNETRYAAMANGTAINFYDGQGTVHAGQVYGHEGERSKHKTDVS